MLSIYKMSSFAIAAAISASLLMSVSTVARAADTTTAAEPMVLAASDISRTEAKKLVRAHLKSEGKRGFRVGNTVRRNGMWIVTVTNRDGIAVYKMTVDAASGELSRA